MYDFSLGMGIVSVALLVCAMAYEQRKFQENEIRERKEFENHNFIYINWLIENRLPKKEAIDKVISQIHEQDS